MTAEPAAPNHPGRNNGGSVRNPWLSFAIVTIGSFLGPLSGSITNVALPAMAADYQVDLQTVKWVVLIYLLVSTSLIPVVGKLGGWAGEGRTYIVGFAIFALASVFCALAPPSMGLGWIVAGRGLQAIGSAMLFAVSLGLVTRYVPQQRRSMAFGIIGSVVSIALIIGPPLGVVLTDTLGWRWVFWVLVPVAAAGALAGLHYLPRDQRLAAGRWGWPSALLWSILVTGLVLISEAYSKGLWLEFVPYTIGATAVAIALFALVEVRGTQLFDYTMFRYPAFWRGSIGGLLVYLSLVVLILLLPFYFDDILNLGTATKGLLFALNPLVMSFTGPLAGNLADRLGFRLPLIGGLSVLIVAYLLMAVSIWHQSLVMLGVAQCLLGLGNGLFSGPNFSAMMGSVAASQRSVASSFCSLTRGIGFLVGTSLGSLWFGWALLIIGGHELMVAARTQVLAEAVSTEQFTHAFGMVLLICVALNIIALAFSLSFPNRVE